MPALKPVYETRAAACRYAQVRQGHGLEILVETNYKNYTLTYEGTAGLQKTVKKNTPEPIEGGFSEYQLRRRGYELKLDFHSEANWKEAAPSLREQDAQPTILDLRNYRILKS